MPPEHPDFDAGRPDDEAAPPPELLGPDAAPEELRPIYDRLAADADGWAATIAPEAPLADYIRSLPRRFPQEAAEMQTPPDHPRRDAGSRPTAPGRPDAPGGGFPGGRTLPAIAAAVLIVALLGGALFALGRGRGGAPTATPTATNAQRTPTPTLIPTPVLPPAGQGWAKTGPAYFYAAAAVAPSQPATLYSCGQLPDSNGVPSAPTYLGVSYDGGKTWRRSPLPAYCATLRVSPTNPRYVAYTGGNCGSYSGCAPGPEGLKSWVYLSTDGGQHWAQATLPPNTADPAPGWGHHIAWAGTTLFVAPLFSDRDPLPAGTHILAASANGGPLAWVDQNGLRDRVASGATVSWLASVGDTLYVTFGGAACTNRQCAAVAKTVDGGATWASFTPTYQDFDLEVIGGTPGRDLLALPLTSTYRTGPPLRSMDGGATWSLLPPLPGGDSPQATGVFEMPDGTVFAETNTNPNPIYKLPPGAGAWSLAAPHVNNAGSGDLAAVSWDAGGHPLLLWEAALGQGLFSHAA